MILNEENYIEKIGNLSKADWKPLLDLIPKIEGTSMFGELKGGEKDEEGVISLPYWVESPIVSQFHQIIYDLPIIVGFNWDEWDEG